MTSMRFESDGLRDPSVCAPATALRGWTRRHWTVAVVATLIFWSAAALAWPLTNAVVPWDSKNHFYPMLRYLAGALANGELPLWNPYHFSGHPSVADPQSLLFTPTMMLFGWLFPSPSMQLFDIAVFAHFLPGALAILALFARRGWRHEGALLAVIVFVLGGSASARLQHTGIILGYGMFPLALLLLEEALDRISYRCAVGFALVASMMVAGRDQVAFLSGLALVGLLAALVISADRPLTYLRDRAGVLVCAGVIGAVTLAVPVVLTMQLVSTSSRPAFGFGVAAMGSLPPESFATLLFGNIFGSLRLTNDYWGPDWHTVIEGTWTDRATNYLFAGTIPAALLVWQGIAGGRLFAREFRYFLWLGIAAIVYALGRYTPVFSVIFDSIPGVSLYRRPADATFLINIALAFAAGYALHRYLVDGLPSLKRLRQSPRAAALVALAITGVASMIAVGLVFATRANQAPTAAAEIALGLGAAVLTAVLMMRGGHTLQGRAAIASLLVAATATELIARNAASALNAEPIARYAVFDQLPPEQLQGLTLLKAELAVRHAKGERPRVEILGLSGAWQNASMVLNLEDTIGYNPLRLADYERAIGPGENAVDPNLRQFPKTFRGYRCRLASLLGLEYLVLDRSVDRLPRHFPRLSGARLLYGSGSMWIYRLDPGSPRTYLATQIVPVDAEAVLDQEELPEFDRRSAALVDEGQLDRLRGDYVVKEGTSAPAPALGSVAISAYSRNVVSLDVETDRDSIVVLHDIYYPGWEAFVDGKSQPILRTNLLFRGVEVGPGKHVVEFRFRPLSLDNLVAAATSLITTEADGEPTTVVR